MEKKGKAYQFLEHLLAPKGMIVNPFTLTFPHELEQRYIRDTYQSQVIIIRLLLILGAFMYALYAVLDYLILPNYLHILYTIRFAIVLPFLAIVFCSSFFPLFKRWGQILMAIAILISATGIIYMTVITSNVGREMYFIGLLLVLFFNYILRLRFLLSTFIGWLIVILYLLSVIFFPEIKKEIMWSHIFFIISINLIGTFAAYSIEFFMRRNYIFSLELNEKKEKVEMMNQSLEEKVREKTLHLKQDIERRKRIETELLSAKEKAEESERLKTAFLNNLSHEVRTPMNGIMGFADMLSYTDPKTDKFKKYISVLKISANRLMNTVDDLIAISKVQTGQIDFIASHFDLQILLQDVISTYKKAAEDKQLKLHFSACNRERIKIFTDKQKLKFIVSSFIKNAINFTELGEVTLSCICKDDGINISVKDTGIGIPKERQAGIFHHFEKADIEDIKAHQGSGLGLSLSLAYAEKMEGIIVVDSEKNKGATFTLQLPLHIIDKQKP